MAVPPISKFSLKVGARERLSSFPLRLVLTTKETHEKDIPHLIVAPF